MSVDVGSGGAAMIGTSVGGTMGALVGSTVGTSVVQLQAVINSGKNKHCSRGNAPASPAVCKTPQGTLG